MSVSHCRLCGGFLDDRGTCRKPTCGQNNGHGRRHPAPPPVPAMAGATAGYSPQEVTDRLAAARAAMATDTPPPAGYSIQSNDVWNRYGLPHAPTLNGYVSPDQGRWRADVVTVDPDGLGRSIDTRRFTSQHAAAAWLDAYQPPTPPTPPLGWSIQSNDIWNKNGLPHAPALDGYVSPENGHWRADVVNVGDDGLGRTLHTERFTSPTEAADWLQQYRP